MSKQVQFRRGNYAESEAFTGAEGEITVDTDNNTLRIHDGVTEGGHQITGNVHFNGNEIALGETELTVIVNKDTTAETLVINGSADEVHLHSANQNESLRLANNNASAYILIAPGSSNATPKTINVRANFLDLYCNLRFHAAGQGIVFTDQSVQRTGVQNRTPDSSKGSAGDQAGYFAFDAQYIYVCISDYNGTSDIWKRISLGDVTTW